MDAMVIIQLSEQRQEFGFGGFFRQDMRVGAKAEIAAGALLHADVDLRSGVFADTNECQARLNAAAFEAFDPLCSLAMDFFRNGFSIDEIVKRHYGTASSFSTAITGVFGQRSSSNSSPTTWMR